MAVVQNFRNLQFPEVYPEVLSQFNELRDNTNELW